MNSARSRQLAAEAVGTFLLATSVGLSVQHPGAVPTPVIAGLTLMILVYILGPVSGCQINPAVTLGLWSSGKLELTQALQYVLVQLIGGLAALAVLSGAQNGMMSVPAAGSPGVWLAEAFGAFILVLGVASVVHEKTPAPAAGLAIGGSLLIGATAASSASNGVVNPAVAVGIGSVSVAYIVAPVIGGMLAAWLYRSLVAAR